MDIVLRHSVWLLFILIILVVGNLLGGRRG
jgi:hypothetical protein